MQSNVSSQHQIGPFLREVFMAIVNRIFAVLGKPADEKDAQVRYKVSLGILDLIWHRDKSSPYTAVSRKVILQSGKAYATLSNVIMVYGGFTVD